MSLTDTDLLLIRGIVQETVQDAIEGGISPLRGEIRALRNGVKELYDMTTSFSRHKLQINKRMSNAESDITELKLSFGLQK